MLPWKIFVHMTSKMVRLHLDLLLLRPYGLQLIPKNLWLLSSSSTLFQAGFDNILTFLKKCWIVYCSKNIRFEGTIKM